MSEHMVASTGKRKYVRVALANSVNQLRARPYTFGVSATGGPWLMALFKCNEGAASSRQLSKASGVMATYLTASIACLVVFLPYEVLSFERFDQPKELLYFTLATIIAFQLIVYANTITLQVTDILLAVFVLLGFLSVQTAANPWFAWRGYGIAVAGMIMYTAARFLSGIYTRRLIAALALIIALLATIGLAEAYGLLPRLSPAGQAPGGTIGNRNRLAHILVLGMPAILLCVLTAREKWRLLLFLLAAFVNAWHITLSRSRAAWLAVAIAFLVTSVMYVLSTVRSRVISPRRLVVFVTVVIMGGIAAAMLPNQLAWRTSLTSSIVRVLDHRQGSGAGRLIQYSNTTQMIVDHPLVGVGPGNWTVEYPRYASAHDPSYRPFALRPTNRLPQSDWFGLAAERGLPAIISLLMALCLLLIGTLHDWRASSTVESVTLIGVVLSLLVIGLLDAVLLTVNGSLIAFSLLGALAPRSMGWVQVQPKISSRAVMITVVIALMYLPLFQSIQRIRASMLASVPTWERLERAVRIDEGNYEARVRLGAQLARRGNCHRALPLLKEAAALFPTAYPPRALYARCRGAAANIP